ncbi:pyridoxal kinase PdxY [Corynebacterium tapiri]|uniref:Pyridoxal kinase PdxY n=1 Tax=Corynebacterium tapiri TaxID=1448266 RepID=A0A5C4U490_9CORY|nr:pyridoxal kinase PdxY [Corynebacterium tapiri]TNL96589.1 pyridoxal kinase PdxY [Corynebacterium tapiri]
MKHILSIQSHVTYGHVGNSAAVFPLQRIGHEVWPIHTVAFSNHTGYGSWGGPMIPAEDVRSIVSGVDHLGKLGEVDAVISGYQGGTDIAGAITDTVRLVKEKNPQAIYSCDPVMGNAKSGCFVSDEIPPLLRDVVVPVADVITPNQFELGYLTGCEATDLDSTIEAAQAARQMGPKTVLVTSVRRPDQPEDTIEMMVVTDAGVWSVSTPYLPFKRNGSGDVTAALFTGHLLSTGDAAQALGKTAASVYDLLNFTYEADSRELELVAGQEAFVSPAQTFEVVRVD